jgi:hypothetical protein
MTIKINTNKQSWVNNGEIDPAYLEWGSKQEPRASTELIQPFSTTVPHLVWLPNDDDVVLKMKQRRIIASDS